MNDPATSERPDELIGRVLGGRYRVVAPLGAGGMGAVYRARQLDIGRELALKTLHPLLTKGDHLVRFRREAEAAAALRHPNIIEVSDYCDRAGEPAFLVMELLEGRSLSEILSGGARLAPRRAATLAAQLLSALGAAHRAGIVHRDLKPSNVHVVPLAAGGELVKLLDFGVAKLKESEGYTKLTVTGAIVGTPHYMAPEQACGDPVDARADLYAVGAILYQMLGGRTPHRGSQIDVLIRAICETDPPPLSELAPDVDPRLVAVAERALQKAPSARYPSAEAMLADLTRFLGAPEEAAGTAAPSGPRAGPTVDLRPPRAREEPTASTLREPSSAPATLTPSGSRPGGPTSSAPADLEPPRPGGSERILLASLLAVGAGAAVIGGCLLTTFLLTRGDGAQAGAPETVPSAPTTGASSPEPPEVAPMEPLAPPSDTATHPAPASEGPATDAPASSTTPVEPPPPQPPADRRPAPSPTSEPAPRPRPRARRGGGGVAPEPPEPEPEPTPTRRARLRGLSAGGLYTASHVRERLGPALSPVGACLARHRRRQTACFNLGVDPRGRVQAVRPAATLPGSLTACVDGALRRVDLGPTRTGAAGGLQACFE